MGANFINTVLEAMAGTLRKFILHTYPEENDRLEIIMAILSNHVPECLVECSVSCPVEDFGTTGEMPADLFVQKFKTAVDIALIDPYRAATHNKGIMNGIDAVVLATGNDFRAVEAGAHVYASKGGAYKSLSVADIKNGVFSFRLTMPMAVGTVGGLTALHPLAKRAMQILGNPDAKELMMVIAAAGLANNFSAVKALVSKGIQHGHMKMHLPNMLIPYNLNPEQKKQVEEYFRMNPVSYAAVADYIKQLLKNSNPR
jgi:hydroxymethylglutaryl-CoA reductase